jgi:hypothetical protein
VAIEDAELEGPSLPARAIGGSERFFFAEVSSFFEVQLAHECQPIVVDDIYCPKQQ